MRRFDTHVQKNQWWKIPAGKFYLVLHEISFVNEKFLLHVSLECEICLK